MTEIDDATLGDLHSFGALNRLCVSKTSLVVSKISFKASQTPRDIWESIPPVVEELRVEIDPVNKWLVEIVLPVPDEGKELAMR